MEASNHLEQILLVTQALLLLLPQLVQTVVVSIKIDELVIPLGTCFTYSLADLSELFAWLDDSRVDELKFRSEGLCGINQQIGLCFIKSLDNQLLL
jgi:hypothetical protein